MARPLVFQPPLKGICMVYAIEALKCEKERLLNEIESQKSGLWHVQAIITDRELRVKSLEDAIAHLMETA